ncbi:MAG: hypothetical protein AB7U83_19910 [Vicinamibacterales bacterium]
MEDKFSIQMRQMRALNEYARQESLAYFREHPDSLRAVREDLAKRNAYLAEQGLPLLPDRYPELPES